MSSHQHASMPRVPIHLRSSISSLPEDGGFLDGETITSLKRARGVDVLLPVKSNMHTCREAVALAEMAAEWERHPTHPEQQIATVLGIEHVWDASQVGLSECDWLLQ